MGSLQKAASQPTNLSKVSQVMQEKNVPREHLERFLKYIGPILLFDPEAREHQSAVNKAFVNHTALTSIESFSH